MEKERGKQLLESKVRIPEMAHNLIERTRLLEMVETDETQIIVFNAGAGFGKTILMAELARRHENHCIWYQIDSSDNDQTYFFNGLLYALSKVFQESKEAREDFNGLNLSGDQMKRTVFLLSEKIARHMDGELYFMLDDFHEIQDETVFTMLSLLIDHLPSKVHFCFTVKGSFPHFLASYIMKGKVQLLEVDQLRFTEKETRCLLNQQTAGRIPDTMVNDILEYMEGWPAGVMFACLALRVDNSSGDIPSVVSHTKIFDYIYYEIFRKLPYEIQCFLIDTSSLQSLTPALCNYVTGRMDSGSILDYLVGENMFVYKFSGYRKWYRYHSIFRDFLQSRRKPERKKEILTKAAQYSMRIGEMEQAVVYGMQCEAYDVIALGIEKQAGSMMEQGRQSTLRQWVEYLNPAREKLSYSALHTVYQFLWAEKEEEKAAEYLEMAVSRARQAGEYESYGRYGLELVEYLEAHGGIGRALEEAEQLESVLGRGICSSRLPIHVKILEYRLQLGDRLWMEEFAGKKSERNWKPQAAMERNAVAWALGLIEKRDGWGNTLEEARMYRRVSPVFMEYGFFCYGWFLYLNRDERYREVLREGLSVKGKSIYSQWMQILALLDNLKTKKYDNEYGTWREEICRLEKELEKQGLEYPAFLEEDEMLLTDIVLGNVPKWETSKKAKTVLRVFCLGSFTVWSGEEMLSWRTKKAKELFACLFSQEGKGLEKNGLIFRLWPEATEKNGSVLFNTTVSYLRRTLAQVGMADILVVRDRLYSLDMGRIWSDVGRLEELAELIKKKRYEDIKNPQELISLYCGEYFGSEDYRWMVGKKEYVEQLFVQSARQMAEYEAEKKHYDLAVLILQKMLEVHTGSLEVLRLLMICRWEQGDRTSARRQYLKMRQIWEEDWEQELPEELEEFIKGEDGEECGSRV